MRGVLFDVCVELQCCMKSLDQQLCQQMHYQAKESGLLLKGKSASVVHQSTSASGIFYALKTAKQGASLIYISWYYYVPSTWKKFEMWISGLQTIWRLSSYLLVWFSHYCGMSERQEAQQPAVPRKADEEKNRGSWGNVLNPCCRSVGQFRAEL